MSVLSRLLPGTDGSARSVTIEPMRRRHLRHVVEIEQRTYPKPWTRAVFESELDQVATKSRHYVVARRGREVVGYAGLWFVPDDDNGQAHVTNLVVAPDVRREGIGARMLANLAEAAITRGCSAWTLEVRASNVAAQELYRRFGFAPAGVRKRYYENVEDAIVMWCHELQQPEYAAAVRAVGEDTQ